MRTGLRTNGPVLTACNVVWKGLPIAGSSLCHPLYSILLLVSTIGSLLLVLARFRARTRIRKVVAWSALAGSAPTVAANWTKEQSSARNAATKLNKATHRHHASLAGSHRRNRHACSVPRVWAHWIHDSRRGSLGHFSAWRNSIRARGICLGDRRDHWVVAGAALSEEAGHEQAINWQRSNLEPIHCDTGYLVSGRSKRWASVCSSSRKLRVENWPEPAQQMLAFSETQLIRR